MKCLKDLVRPLNASKTRQIAASLFDSTFQLVDLLFEQLLLFEVNLLNALRRHLHLIVIIVRIVSAEDIVQLPQCPQAAHFELALSGQKS